MKSKAMPLAEFLSRAGSVAVVTGAGVSTASGIPEYRDRDGNWKHPQPVQYGDFVRSPSVRRRYWARSFAGWNRIVRAIPNRAHTALAELEASGRVGALITQNVDSLHRRAGSRRVIDLHGRLDTVRCLACDTARPREEWQQRLLDENPNWHARIEGINPDGDADIPAADETRFDVPDCRGCGGIVKPDVVFFGEQVPRPRVDRARQAVASAGALLVVGSSLMVFSGLRFARQARELGKPIAILNRGRTRADELADLKVDADCGQILDDTLALLERDSLAAGHAS